MSEGRLTVKVIDKQGGPKWVGYYDHRRRKAGEVFELEAPEHFSAKWMEPVGWIPSGYTKQAQVSKKSAKMPRTPLVKPVVETPLGDDVI